MKSVLFLCAFVLMSSELPAQSIDTTNTIFGPNVYERFTGSPTQYQDEFVVPSGVDTPFVLYIFNGNPDGTQRVSSASIYLNGVEVVTESEFNQEVASIEKQVELAGEDTIVIFLEITSQPYAFITLGITARDTLKPDITITWPPNNHVTDSSAITVSGIITDRTPVEATINDSDLTLQSNGSFSYEFPLIEGPNTIVISATDYFGNSASDSVTVTRSSGPELIAPANDSTNTPLLVMLVWHTLDSATIDYQVQVATDSTFSSIVFNDSTIADTSRMMTMLDPGTLYYWRINGRDTSGRSGWSDVWHFTTRADTIPVLVVAPIDTTIPFVMISEATRFIYAGANAVQFGVDTTKLDAFCGAVIRGRVVTGDTTALPGVKVSISDHKEFGYTFSRADGMFDMVVNGAATYTLTYEKEGYFNAHRDVSLDCGNFAYADTMGLVRPDVAATTIRFEEPMEIALSSVFTDADGSRRVALAFEQGTIVEMVLPDSTIDTLSTITVRSTEYTVGPGGPNAMPALLPPTSGYTYAANLTVDEGILANATEVRFSKCPRFYVENFIGFPVGMKVPVGYYRFFERRWVPLEDGRVIQIVDTSGGIAAVAVDDSGTVSDSARLAEFGITDLERQYLATLYGPGDEIMRTCVDYFGQYDKNCGIIAPEGATAANAPEPDFEIFNLQYPSMEPSASVRAVSDIMNQVAERDVPVTGAPFSLHYTSEFQEGRKPELFIDVSGDSISEDLRRIIVEVTVAGQLTRDTVSALPNQTYHYTWDRKDAYGRTVTGEFEAVIRIGYSYLGEYQLPTYIRNNFALMSGQGITPLIKSRQEVTLWQTLTKNIEAMDNRISGINGWTASSANVLNRETSTLYFGNGQKKRLSTISNGVGAISKNDPQGWLNWGSNIGFTDIESAPDGSLYIIRVQTFFSGPSYRIIKRAPDGQVTQFAGGGTSSADSIHISQAQIGGVEDLDIDAQGNIYFINGVRIRKVDQNGIVTYIAGDGSIGFGGDGDTATQAKLNFPQGLAVTGDGIVYIGDTGNNRVRRVGLDGIITTVIGSGAFSPQNFTEGMAATAYGLGSPGTIAVGFDGSVFVRARSGYSRPGSVTSAIYRLGTDGLLYHFLGIRQNLGTTHPGPLPDGTLATEADIGLINRIVIGRDGLFYFGCNNPTGVLRRWLFNVDSEGKIRSIVGGGRFGLATGFAGLPPREVDIYPRALTFGPYGTLYFIVPHIFGNQFFQVAPSTLTLVDDKYEVSSNDGSMIYVFDKFGRHIETKNAISGTRLFSFVYNGLGKLTQVIDRDSLISTIERDSTGKITAIISPKNERTEVTLDANGMITSVENPNNEAISFDYAEGGLMSSLTLPSSDVQQMWYDDTGKLDSASTAATGVMHLERTQIEDGYQVEAVSPTGITTDMNVLQFPTGLQTITASDGLGRTTYASLNPEGIDTLKTPDGTVIIQKRAYDPRFGNNVAIPESTITRTPGGLVSAESRSREVTATEGTTPVEITDKTVINNRTFTSVFNNNTKLQTNTSAENIKTFTTFNSIDLPVKDSTGGILGTSYAYDSEGRVTSMTQGTRVTTYTYDTTGRLQASTDPTGRTDSLYYDAAGRVIRQVFADGRVVLYEYDANGNLTGITPPGKPEHTFTYDGDNRPLSYTPPIVPVDSLTPSFYEYDNEGRLKKTTFADSTFISVAYDTVDGKQRSVAFDRGTTYFDYDSASGNLTRIIGASEDTLLYSYDGSLLTEEKWQGEVDANVQFAYDNSFRIIKQKVNGIDSVSFVYDKDDMLTKAGSLSIVRNAQHGKPASDTLGGVIGTYTYDTFGNLATMTYRYSSDTLYKVTYTRDSLDRITQKVEKVEGTTTTHGYSYDQAGRLFQVMRNDTLVASYFYDSNGNRDSVVTLTDTTTASYDNQDRLLTYSNTLNSYTPRGELSVKIEGSDTTRYTYDNLGNLVTVVLPNGDRIDYLIDGKNRRIGKQVNGATVKQWVYDGDLRPVAELDSAGNIEARFVYAEKANVPEYIVKGGATYRLITDHLGSWRLLVNTSTGSVAGRAEYDEWGNVTSSVDTLGLPFGFAGGMFEEGTGLVRFGARDYEGEFGRWIIKDPILFASSERNMFVYASNDAVNGSDPYGEDAFSAAGTIIGAIFDLAAFDVESARQKAFEATTGATQLRFPGEMFALGHLGYLPTSGFQSAATVVVKAFKLLRQVFVFYNRTKLAMDLILYGNRLRQ